MMTKLKSAPTLAGRADRLAQAVFVDLASEKVPDHLIQLVDQLEAARQTGRLSRERAA
jgi:hypothetical protein